MHKFRIEIIMKSSGFYSFKWEKKVIYSSYLGASSKVKYIQVPT